MPAERIQKLLANVGVGSRRQIEKMIVDGRIIANGQPAHLGQKVTPKDIIEVDGKRIDTHDVVTTHTVIAYHKPVGEITGKRDPHGRPSVFEALPKPSAGRWIVVGRLDINTCGLLLFTTDGELANRLMHPSNSLQREYAVRVLGDVSAEKLDKLVRGIELEDGWAKFKRIREGGGEGANRWFRVVLTEGRNREVRRLWEAVDCKVSRLIRVRFGNIDLDKSLRPGKSRELTPGETADLYRLAGITDQPPTVPQRGTPRTPSPSEAAATDRPPRKKKKRLYRR